MSQMRQRWKKRRGGEDGEERKGAAEAGTMVGGGGQKKRAQKRKTKGEGEERGRDGSWELCGACSAKSDGLLMRSASSQVTAVGWAAAGTQQNHVGPNSR